MRSAPLSFPGSWRRLTRSLVQLCLNLFKNEFIEITTKLSAVVACRCSPTQKADVARLIRSYTKKRVCCIGDGGNDVSMIQAADVGQFLSPLPPISRTHLPLL